MLPLAISSLLTWSPVASTACEETLYLPIVPLNLVSGTCPLLVSSLRTSTRVRVAPSLAPVALALVRSLLVATLQVFTYLKFPLLFREKVRDRLGGVRESPLRTSISAAGSLPSPLTKSRSWIVVATLTDFNFWQASRAFVVPPRRLTSMTVYLAVRVTLFRSWNTGCILPVSPTLILVFRNVRIGLTTISSVPPLWTVSVTCLLVRASGALSLLTISISLRLVLVLTSWGPMALFRLLLVARQTTPKGLRALTLGKGPWPA